MEFYILSNRYYFVFDRVRHHSTELLNLRPQLEEKATTAKQSDEFETSYLLCSMDDSIVHESHSTIVR